MENSEALGHSTPGPHSSLPGRTPSPHTWAQPRNLASVTWARKFGEEVAGDRKRGMQGVACIFKDE